MLVTDTSAQLVIYRFEMFLTELFVASGLPLITSFRVTGEQINGRFRLDRYVYVLEARWHDHPTPQSDLLAFRDKVATKAH